MDLVVFYSPDKKSLDTPISLGDDGADEVVKHTNFARGAGLVCVLISHFTCRSLTVGSWRRIGQNAMDLVVFYSPDKALV
jgi:hypothetical protein